MGNFIRIIVPYRPITPTNSAYKSLINNYLHLDIVLVNIPLIIAYLTIKYHMINFEVEIKVEHSIPFILAMKTFKYISISQQTARTQQREYYHFDDELRRALVKRLKASFRDIDGLMLLSTCNRTEIYFESVSTMASEIHDYLIDLFNPFDANQDVLFDISNDSEITAKHLLEVANGMQSAVIGDGQILAQIKEAYHFSLSRHLQGSLMERAIQAVFRSHKRISNETSFRNGSRSTSYRALKLLEKNFGKNGLENQHLLLIGAGEISIELLKYFHKFKFKSVTITNRTESKSTELAQIYELNTTPWSAIESNSIEAYDIIITAVSNRKDLIHSTSNPNQVFVDLALPANVSQQLSNTHTVYNLDQLTEEIDETDALQRQAISTVHHIIHEELTNYSSWLNQSEMRELLGTYKKESKKLILSTIEQYYNDNGNEEDLEQLAELIANKLVRRSIKHRDSEKNAANIAEEQNLKVA